MTNTYNQRVRTGLTLLQPAGTWTNSFGYDAAKRLTSLTSPAGTFSDTLTAASAASPLPKKLLLPNTSYITNTYDTMARLKGTYLKTSGNVLTNKHEYNYSVGRQRTQQTFMDGATYDYTYDKIGQLKVADSSVAAQDRGYLYDAAWNLNKRTNNGVVGTFTADNKNQLTSSTPSGPNSFDGNGNLTNYNSGALVCSYDDENRLTRGEDIDKHKWATDFVYDGRGRLRSRLEYSWNGST